MKLLITFLSFINFIFGQKFEIELNELTTLDEEVIHVAVLKDKPHKKLILPDNYSDYKFLDLFFDWESGDDKIVSVAILQKDSSDFLFVDFNNDNDLTNDGTPIIFPLSENTLSFDVYNLNNNNQKTRLVLSRKPNFPDSVQSHFIDEEGNLLQPVVNIYGSAQNFKGEKRTFFFDDLMSLRRGTLNLEDKEIKIGLFDYNNNGKFNDDEDVFIIDLNRDNKLDYIHDEDIFRLNDIINIYKKNYKLGYINPYGLKIVLEETTEEPTKYFSFWNKISYNDHTYKLEQEFWENKFINLNSNLVDLKKFKGKYLFVNFWGEWCIPCLEEIPHLVKARNKYSSKVEFISFLKTYNLEKAKKFIKENNIEWIQIELPEDIEKKFIITGYPTNLLIFPDGLKFLKQGMVKEDFFDKHLK